MHTEIRVVKEAAAQLKKANSWVIPALLLDDIDEELRDQWGEIVDKVLEELHDYLENRR